MIPFLQLEREDGREAVVRADEIGVVLTDTHRPRGSDPNALPIPALSIMLRNNTTVKVIGISRATLFKRMASALGKPVSVYKPDGTAITEDNP